MEKENENKEEHFLKQEEHNKEMAVTEKAQLKYQKLAFLMSAMSAGIMVIILIIVICLASYTVPKVDTIYNSTMRSLDNLEALTEELKEAKVGETVKNINNLTLNATGDLSSAMAKLNAVDLDTLNDAITDLYNIVEPLAKLLRVVK